MTEQNKKLWTFKGLVCAPSGSGKSWLDFKDILP